MSTLQTTHSPLLIDTSSAKLFINTARNTFESKELPSPGLFVKKILNYDTCSLGNSLCDLEAPSSALLNRKDSYMSSLASTNDGSRFCLEGKTFTRGHSLEPEAVGQEEEKFRLSLSPEKPYGGQIFDYVDECSEILENCEEEALNQSIDLSKDLLNESQGLCAVVTAPAKLVPRCEDVRPVFSRDGANSSQYDFSNEDRTVEYKLNTRYTALYATEALSSTGKSTFSVRVNHCKKEHAKLYVGVAASNLKGQAIGYKPGFYFISAFSRESYLNGLKIVEQEDLPEEGEVIKVTVDMEKAWISFELEKGVITEGKMSLPKGKTNEFYPCIALGEAGGSVSFV